MIGILVQLAPEIGFNVTTRKCVESLPGKCPAGWHKINSGLTVFEEKIILESAPLNANGVWSCTLALSIPVEFDNHILFYHSSFLLGTQSTQASKWLELFLVIFRCLKHGGLFGGCKANYYFKVFLKIHPEFLMFACEHTLDYKIPWLSTKMHSRDSQRKFICFMSPLMSISSERVLLFVKFIDTQMCTYSYIQSY